MLNVAIITDGIATNAVVYANMDTLQQHINMGVFGQALAVVLPEHYGIGDLYDPETQTWTHRVTSEPEPVALPHYFAAQKSDTGDWLDGDGVRYSILASEAEADGYEYAETIDDFTLTHGLEPYTMERELQLLKRSVSMLEARAKAASESNAMLEECVVELAGVVYA